jgi:molybdopterin adenylyltransferase
MAKEHSSVPRTVVAIVAPGRASAQEDVARIVVDELQVANLAFVRTVTVTREKHFIQQLVSNIANNNEADAIIFVGGVGVGPRDFTCEAIDSLVDQRLEGFGEAYRRLLREELNAGARSLLQRATAGVYNKCVVFALPRVPVAVRRAMQTLVVPTLAEAVRVASGS